MSCAKIDGRYILLSLFILFIIIQIIQSVASEDSDSFDEDDSFDSTDSSDDVSLDALGEKIDFDMENAPIIIDTGMFETKVGFERSSIAFLKLQDICRL